MNLKKLSKTEKDAQRAEYKEFQIIVERYRAIGFHYVIFRPPKTKICFGSSIERQVLPADKKICPQLGPGHYDITYYQNQDHPILKNKKSKKGYGGLAHKAKRFRVTDCDANFFELYAPRDADIKRHFKPFGIGVRRTIKKGAIASYIPPPGTYYPMFTRNDIRMHTFGGPTKVKQAVQMICSIKNESVCNDCKQKPIVGDYWKNGRTNDAICAKCMKAKRRDAIETKSIVNRYRRELKLNDFSMVRHCEFYHDHRKTKAAIRLLTNNELKRKFRRENYLSMFK